MLESQWNGVKWKPKALPSPKDKLWKKGAFILTGRKYKHIYFAKKSERLYNEKKFPLLI